MTCWPSFLAAIVAEGCFFSLFDPAGFVAYPGPARISIDCRLYNRLLLFLGVLFAREYFDLLPGSMCRVMTSRDFDIYWYYGPQVSAPAAIAFNFDGSRILTSRFSICSQPCALEVDSSRLMLSMVSPRVQFPDVFTRHAQLEIGGGVTTRRIAGGQIDQEGRKPFVPRAYFPSNNITFCSRVISLWLMIL